jgi:DNA modification methylase
MHLGYTEVDCVVLDIDEQKEKALNVALNKISGDWDMPLLTALLQDLNDGGYDATLTGFDVSEMSELFDDQSEIKEDEPPEAAPAEQEPYTRSGDIWLLGRHVLMCGDSTNPCDVRALMGGSVADLCITDPPYNVAYEGSNGKTIQNDNMPEAQFVAFLTAAFKCMRENMKEGAPFYIWHAETEGGAFRQSCTAALGKVRQMLIWNKNAFTMGHQDYQWKHEACIYGWTEGASHYFVDDRTQATVIEDKRIDINKLKKEEMRQLLRDIFSDKVSTTVLNEDKPTRNADHPTMKPLKLLARLVKNSSRQGDSVLDTFGGSGSTLITCEQLGRRCFTMELDPRYADVIVKRYINFTGADTVTLIRNGQKNIVTCSLILGV